MLLVACSKAAVRYKPYKIITMKRQGYLYSKVYDFGNLYRAFLATRRGKRNNGDAINFEMVLGCNLYQLKKELESMTYRPGPYRTFIIHEPKKRVIRAPQFRDRVVHHSLCDNVLEPIFERHFIPFTFACRKNKGTHAALDCLQGQMQDVWRRNKNSYILKCDIKKYFDNIHHDIIKQKIRKLIKDPNLLFLIDLIVDSTEGNVGIPIGNLTSQWFANYYLSDMDHFIKEKLRIKHYLRYMDDFTLIHKDRFYLRECKQLLEDYLIKIGLEFNSKTQMFPIKNGVDFLGFHTYISDTGRIIRKLRRDSKRRMKRKMKYFANEYQKGIIELEQIRACVHSWIGHATHGDTYNLRKRILNKHIFSKGMA